MDWEAQVQKRNHMEQAKRTKVVIAHHIVKHVGTRVAWMYRREMLSYIIAHLISNNQRMAYLNI